MARPLKEIEQELMNLSHEERARLAHELIVSLDQDEQTEEGVEAAWLEEVKRRDAEIERGEVRPSRWMKRCAGRTKLFNKQ